MLLKGGGVVRYTIEIESVAVVDVEEVTAL